VKYNKKKKKRHELCINIICDHFKRMFGNSTIVAFGHELYYLDVIKRINGNCISKPTQKESGKLICVKSQSYKRFFNKYFIKQKIYFQNFQFFCIIYLQESNGLCNSK